MIEVRSSKIFSMCRRRYSDFQWLYKRLLLERSGAIVPIIPHRKALTPKVRFSEDLVAERQAVLQQFLCKVLVHPELKDAPSLMTFVTADYTVWEAAKNKDDVVSATETGSTTGSTTPRGGDGGDEEEEERNLKATATTTTRFASFVGNVFGKAKARLALAGGMEMEQTPDDALFEEFEAYVAQLENNIKILSKEATIFVASTKSQAANLEHMGAAFAAMGEYKLGEATVKTSSAALWTKLGENFTVFTRLANTEHKTQQDYLDRPLQDLQRDVQSLKLAMQQRKEVLYEYTRKAGQGKSKLNALDRLKDTPNANPDKINVMEGELAILKDEGMVLWKNVDIISKRLQRDIERFRFEFHEKLRATMESYAQTQSESTQRSLDEWKRMASHVAGKPPAASETEETPPLAEEAITASL